MKYLINKRHYYHVQYIRYRPALWRTVYSLSFSQMSTLINKCYYTVFLYRYLQFLTVFYLLALINKINHKDEGRGYSSLKGEFASLRTLPNVQLLSSTLYPNQYRSEGCFLCFLMVLQR